MIKMPIIIGEMNLFIPPVFRYLEDEYINQFIKKGLLRLSSFKRFTQHKDEQRLDDFEGSSLYVGTSPENGGQTITAWMEHGVNAYVLSTSMILDKKLASDFMCNSAIKIDNPINFGMSVAISIPNFVSCLIGPCYYQNLKIIKENSKYIDPQNVDVNKMKNNILAKVNETPYFLKSIKYSNQLEFRFIWFSKNEADDYIDIHTPNSTQFCSSIDGDLFLKQ